MFILITLSAQINMLLKGFFQVKRPIYYDKINSLYIESAPGYSFPSGHTQGSATFWYYSMNKIKNGIVKVLGWFVIILVAFSRLYLRVHWPIDAIGGFVIGIAFVYVFENLEQRIAAIKFNYITTFIIALVLPNTILMFLVTETVVKFTGLITGALLGYFIENKFIDFKEKNQFFNQIIKYIIGICVLFAVKEIVKIVFPQILAFHYIRYLLVGIWTTLLAPYIFVKLNLA